MEKAARALVLLSAAVVNQQQPDQKLLSDVDLDALYAAAHWQQMTVICSAALRMMGITAPAFVEEERRQSVKDVYIRYEQREVQQALERAQIWYMPLKGTVMKEYYPSSAMRQMGDVDILFDAARAGEVQQAMEALGFEKDPEDEIDHQEVYRKPPVSVFEMHTMLFDTLSDRRLYDYYQNLEGRLLGDGFERHLSDEDFYLYMIAHEYKHYIWCGTGLRSLLDTYVFLKCFEGKLDLAYIQTEAKKLGIDSFEAMNRTLALKVFGEGNLDQLTDDEQEMLEYFVASGVYGVKVFDLVNKYRRKGWLKYLQERIFMPMIYVQYHYPFFYKHKILLPFLPIYRLVHGVRNIRTEMTALSKEKKRKAAKARKQAEEKRRQEGGK